MKFVRTLFLLIIVFLLISSNLHSQIKQLNISPRNNINKPFNYLENANENGVFEKESFENHFSQILKTRAFDSTTVIDSVIFIKADGNKEKQIYQYLPAENNFKMIYQIWDGNYWADDWIHSYQFNDSDQIISRCGIYWNDNQWDTTWCYYYDYDEYGNLITDTQKYVSLNGQWVNYDRTTYTYNSLNQKIYRLDEDWDGNDWVGKWRAEYGYDSNGNRNFWLSQSREVMGWINDRRTNAIYDNNGNKLLYQVEISVGLTDWEFDYRNTYSYNVEGQVLHYAKYRYENDHWKNTAYYKYEYDESFNLVYELYGNYNDTSWVNVYSITYDNNLNGQPLSELIQVWVENDWGIQERGLYEYDINGNLVKDLRELWQDENWVPRIQKQFGYMDNYLIHVNQEYMINGEWVPYSLTVKLNDLSGRIYYINGSSITIYYNSLSDVDKNQILLNSYQLSQNYPNPFNQSTTIKYSIPNGGNESFRSVQLKIYDVLGREVATPVNKEQSPGDYEVQFDASGLTSGIYFYKLQSGSFVESRKMVLLR